jgi:hypothetical protein
VRSVAGNKSATPARSKSACLAAGGKPEMGSRSPAHGKADESQGDRSEAH